MSVETLLAYPQLNKRIGFLLARAMYAKAVGNPLRAVEAYEDREAILSELLEESA